MRMWLAVAAVVQTVLLAHCFHNQLCGVGYKYDPVEGIEFLRTNFVELLPEPHEALSSVQTNLSLSLIAFREKGTRQYSFVLEVFWHGGYWLGVKQAPSKSLTLLANGQKFEFAATSVESDVSEESCYSLDRYCIERRRLEMAIYEIDKSFIRSLLLAQGPVLIRLKGEYASANGYLLDSGKECIREFLQAIERDTYSKPNTKQRLRKQKRPAVPLF